MNVKKFLKDTAKQDREALSTDSDEIFLDDLKNKVEENSVKRKNSHARFWVSGLIGAMAMILVVVSVLVFYPHSDNEIKYLEKDFEQVASNLEEVENSLRDFTLTIDSSEYSCVTVKVIDTVSGDTIYYILKIQSFDLLKNIEMVIVTNENYHYNAAFDAGEFISLENSSYSFIYYTDKSIDEEFGLEVLIAQAELHKANEYIYVLDYSELLLDPVGSFIETIQGMIE